MAHPSPRSSVGVDEKGSYRSSTAAGKQSFKSTNLEPNQQKSFWSVLAKKAKSVLLDDNSSTCTNSESEVGQSKSCETLLSQYAHARPPAESKQQRGEAPMLQKRLVAFTSSLSSLGGTIGNAIEEGLNRVETKASDLLSSDSRLSFTKKTSETAKTGQQRDHVTKSPQEHNNVISPLTNKDPIFNSLQQEQSISKPVKQQIYTSVRLESWQTLHANPLQQEASIRKPLQQQGSRISDQPAADKETQLKASRDVAMAMAAKAKLLLRELKEAKADLAMARDRCAQLEEENKSIRESLSSGHEEDLVRIQLETLLAEKARLAQENAYYARENQFLREMIEYHRLTMQGGGAFLEECVLEATEISSDFNTEETDDLPPETIISTIS